MTATTAWTSLLNERDIRITPQRRYILDLLYRHNEMHPTVEQMLMLAVKDGRQLSQATLYRTLAVLEDAGLVRKQVLHAGAAHYELSSTLSGKGRPHHHLVCLGCGRIYEAGFHLPMDTLSGLLTQSGFRVVGHELIIYGYCPACQNYQNSKPTVTQADI